MKAFKKLIENGSYQEAIDGLTELLKSDLYNTEALVWLAKAQYKLGQYNQAIDNYNSLINLLPNIADLYSDRGLCFHMAQDFQSALNDFNKAVELEPDNSYRYSSRAFVKDYYKDHQGALNDYNKAIELDPDDAIAYNNRGVLEEKLGYASQAQDSFNRSNEIQGIDLDKELANINTSAAPTITLSKSEKPILTWSRYWGILKSIFSSKTGFNAFFKFLFKKNRVHTS